MSSSFADPPVASSPRFRVRASTLACLLVGALGAGACSDSKSPSDAANAGSGDTTGDGGSGESGNAGNGGAGTGGSGGGNGSGGTRNEGGSAGVALNNGGTGGVVTVEPAIPVVPDPAKDCGAASTDAIPEL